MKPVASLAVAIAVSVGENRQIVALRLTPPLITASAACITISYASMGVSLRSSSEQNSEFLRALSKTFLIFDKAFFSGSGPGAFLSLN